MGEKFKELLNKTITSSKKIQLPLSATAKPATMVVIDERWNESFHYHYLARFLPDFIEHYSLEQLKLTEKFTRSSEKEQLGLKIRQKLNQENNKKILLKAVNNYNIIIVKRYFLPKKIEISARAKEQYDEFIRRYYTVKSILQLEATFNTNLHSNGDIEIDHQMRSKAKSIFKDNYFDQDLFYEYFNAMPFLTDIYVSAGLEKYREDHLNFKTKGVNQYLKALGKLHSKQKYIGYRKTIRGLNLYREYHSHYLKGKKKRNHAPKAAAIQHLITSGKLEPVNHEDIVPSLKEIVKVYTAFFYFVEQSELNPFDTTKYLDYLHKRFPEIKSKRK